MSFRDFLAAIKSEQLRSVAKHWDDVRGTRTIPAWNGIQPTRIAGALPILWVYRYDRDTDSFTGRLAGDRIERIFGKSFRSAPMREIYPEQDYPHLFARAKRVTCEPAFYRGEGTVFRHVNHYGLGERIMLPLSRDGVLGDGILGATAYESQLGVSPEGALEEESWFSF